MKYLILLILFAFRCLLAFSQNNTLILYENHYLVDDIGFNQVINGQKQGRWIQYEFSDIERIIIGHWDGVDDISGEVFQEATKLVLHIAQCQKGEI